MSNLALQLTDVILNEDGEPFISEQNGNPYFVTKYANTLAGVPVSRKVTRTMWGREDEDGKVSWEIFSPEQAKQLMGKDLSAAFRIEATAIEPQSFVGANGAAVTYSDRAFVVLAGETLAQAVRRSGSRLPQLEATAEVDANTESIVA